MENTRSFQIPPLACFFPFECHPAYPLIAEEWNNWIFSIAHPASDAAKKFLIQCQFPLFTCLCYPCSDSKRLFSIFKMLTWVTLEDDLIDDKDDVGGDPIAAETLCARVRAILEGKAKPHDFQGKAGLGLQDFSDVWNQLREDMPARQEARFARSFLDCLDAVETQIQYRKDERVPDVETYLEMRRQTSWFSASFILIEFSLGIELDEEALQSPAILQLHRAVTDYICWTNDLLSFKKEFLKGDMQNLLSILCFSNSLGLHQNVLQVCDMIREVDQECLELIHHIKNSSLIDKPGMRSYLDCLGYIMAGNLHWFYKSARYHGVDAETASEGRPLDVVLPPSPFLDESSA